MPSKNTMKTYVDNSFYHIYNRGVDKQKIFRSSKDYFVFLNYLEESLIEPKLKKVDFVLQGQSFKGVPRPVKNFKGELYILAFCLMPNHFHLLIKQKGKDTIKSFMSSIVTRYVSYFNRKYDRIGHLFQGRYKAALVLKDEYLLHLSRYIHLNPIEAGLDLATEYSSYPDYLGIRDRKWIKKNIVLDYFDKNVKTEFTKTLNYKDFVEKHKKDPTITLGNLVLD